MQSHSSYRHKCIANAARAVLYFAQSKNCSSYIVWMVAKMRNQYGGGLYIYIYTANEFLSGDIYGPTPINHTSRMFKLSVHL